MTKKVNAFLDSHEDEELEYIPFTAYIRGNNDKLYLSIILDERKKEKEHQKVKSMLKLKNEFEEFETELEFIDYVKNLDISSSIKDSIIKSIYYTVKDLAEAENITRQAIEQRIESKKVLIKKFFDMK